MLSITITDESRIPYRTAHTDTPLEVGTARYDQGSDKCMCAQLVNQNFRTIAFLYLIGVLRRLNSFDMIGVEVWLRIEIF